MFIKFLCLTFLILWNFYFAENLNIKNLSNEENKIIKKRSADELENSAENLIHARENRAHVHSNGFIYKRPTIEITEIDEVRHLTTKLSIAVKKTIKMSTKNGPDAATNPISSHYEDRGHSSAGDYSEILKTSTEGHKSLDINKKSTIAHYTTKSNVDKNSNRENSTKILHFNENSTTAVKMTDKKVTKIKESTQKSTTFIKSSKEKIDETDDFPKNGSKNDENSSSLEHKNHSTKDIITRNSTKISIESHQNNLSTTLLTVFTTTTPSQTSKLQTGQTTHKSTSHLDPQTQKSTNHPKTSLHHPNTTPKNTINHKMIHKLETTHFEEWTIAHDGNNVDSEEENSKNNLKKSTKNHKAIAKVAKSYHEVTSHNNHETQVTVLSTTEHEVLRIRFAIPRLTSKRHQGLKDDRNSKFDHNHLDEDVEIIKVTEGNAEESWKRQTRHHSFKYVG